MYNTQQLNTYNIQLKFHIISGHSEYLKLRRKKNETKDKEVVSPKDSDDDYMFRQDRQVTQRLRQSTAMASLTILQINHSITVALQIVTKCKCN